MKFDSTHTYYRILDNIGMFIKLGIHFIVCMFMKKLETWSHKNTAMTMITQEYGYDNENSTFLRFSYQIETLISSWKNFTRAGKPTLNRGIKSSCRSTLSQMFFANFTEKHLCWSLFLIKLQTCNFMKKRLQHRYFTVKFFWLWRHKLLVIYYIRDSFNGFTPLQFWFCQAISCRDFISQYMTIIHDSNWVLFVSELNIFTTEPHTLMIMVFIDLNVDLICF